MRFMDVNNTFSIDNDLPDENISEIINLSAAFYH